MSQAIRAQCSVSVIQAWPLRSRSSRDPFEALEAARRRLPPDAAFSGLTAAWLHGIKVTPDDPIEATVPKHARCLAAQG